MSLFVLVTVALLCITQAQSSNSLTTFPAYFQQTSFSAYTVKKDIGCGAVVQQIWASRVVDYIMEHHCFVIDLRDTDEFRRGHLPKAVQMDAEELIEGNYEFPKGLPIVVYCGGGSVSLRVARLLSMRGYHVYNLAGGYDAFLRTRDKHL